MKRHIKNFLAGCLILALPSGALAAELPRSALGNSGEIYAVQAGAYGDLFPQGDEVEAERSLVVLDVLGPEEESERLIVPTTLGLETESSPRLLYSKQSGRLNVLWESRIDSEVSLYLIELADGQWSDIEQLYFNADGVLPEIAVTYDSFHLDREEKADIHAERHALHLVWLEDTDDVFMARYTPIIFFNGAFIGWMETYSFPHLNPDANDQAPDHLPSTLKLSANDERDSITFTFGSSASGRLTSYEVGVVSMELVHLSDLIRDRVLDSEFDPEDVAGFADEMGIEIIGMGHRGRGRGRSRLTTSVLDYVASGVRNRILDTAADYQANQLEALADDLRRYALELASALFSASVSEPKSGGEQTQPIFEIDVSDLFDDESDPAPIHVLELRFAIERPLPEAAGEITLYGSDDGLDLLAVWPDPEEEGVVWYAESKAPETTWSESRSLHLGDRLTLKQAHQLLQERIR